VDICPSSRFYRRILLPRTDPVGHPAASPDACGIRFAPKRRPLKYYIVLTISREKLYPSLIMIGLSRILDYTAGIFLHS
jgi:hypothetical protein